MELPTENHWLTKRLVPNIRKRLYELQQNLCTNEFTLIDEIFHMDPQDCYSVFGMSNDTLEECESLYSMLINGLYDDSYLGIIKNPTTDLWIISWVSDNFENTLSEDDVAMIIRSQSIQTKYYADNKDAIEAGRLNNETRNIYRDMFKSHRDLFRTYMREEDLNTVLAEELSHRERLRALLTVNNEASL